MTYALWTQMNAHALLRKRELTMATGSRSAQVHMALLATAHKEVTARYIEAYYNFCTAYPFFLLHVYIYRYEVYKHVYLCM